MIREFTQEQLEFLKKMMMEHIKTLEIWQNAAQLPKFKVTELKITRELSQAIKLKEQLEKGNQLTKILEELYEHIEEIGEENARETVHDWYDDSDREPMRDED